MSIYESLLKKLGEELRRLGIIKNLLITTVKKYPTFIIVGAPRSGTTSLYHYLKATRGVYLPEQKYITYFIGKTSSSKLTEKEYLKHFSGVKNEKVIGEANAVYLADPDSPKLIKNKIPNAKIIILLRDPVERTFSEYNSDMMKEKINCAFSKAILENPPPGKNYPNRGICQKNNILERSLYYEQVKRYYDVFGAENVGVWFTEDLAKDPNQILKQIFNFLGIVAELPNTEHKYSKHSIPRNIIFKHILRHRKILKFLRIIIPVKKLRTRMSDYVYKDMPKPVMLDKDRATLENYFKNDVHNLQKLLNVELINSKGKWKMWKLET